MITMTKMVTGMKTRKKGLNRTNKSATPTNHLFENN
jgi:hypothetical protein